jgi:hypothetical protein
MADACLVFLAPFEPLVAIPFASIDAVGSEHPASKRDRRARKSGESSPQSKTVHSP